MTIPTERDIPAHEGTTELSVALRFGRVSARQVARALATGSPGAQAVVRQLVWRDWYAHTTFARPDIDRRAAPRVRRNRMGDGPRRRHGLRRLEEGRDRLPDRRCRHASAGRDRLDAQSGPHGRGVLPRQGPAGRLAHRRTMVPASPRRRRYPAERRQLAVGRRHGHRRRALFPDLQPDRTESASSIPEGPTSDNGFRNSPDSPIATSTNHRS